MTALVEEGVGSALVAMSKSESKNIHELISRIFNVIVETRDSGKTADGTLVPNQKDVRGLMVQQGATKVLIKLALNGTDKGKVSLGLIQTSQSYTVKGRRRLL